LQAEGEKESPIEKLNRLKCEVVELQQELQLSVIFLQLQQTLSSVI